MRTYLIQRVSARIRGAKTELEELGEYTDDLADGLSKYRNEIVSLSGVDIMKNENEYKDMYDIFVELASVWDDMKSDEARARVAEILGGTRQLSGIMSTITNIKDAMGAYSDAMDSAGASTRANDIYMETTAAHLEKMKATFQELSETFVNTDIFKGFIDFLTSTMTLLNGIVKTLGSLGTITIFSVITKEVLKIKKYLSDNQIIGFKNKITESIKVVKNDFNGLTNKVRDFSATFKTAYAGAIADGATKTKALSTALQSSVSGFGMLTAGVVAAGAAIAAWRAYQRHIKVQVDAAKDAGDEWGGFAGKIEEARGALTDFNDKMDSGLLSDDEIVQAKSGLLSLQNELIETYGVESEKLDLVNGNYEEQLDILRELVAVQSSEFLNENAKGIEVSKKKMEKVDNFYLGQVYDVHSKQGQQLLDIIDELNKKYNDAFSVDRDSSGSAFINLKGNAEDAKDALNDFMTLTRNAFGDTNNFVDPFMKNAENGLSHVKDIVDEYGDIYKKANLASLYANGNDKKYNDKTPLEWYEASKKSVEDLNAALASGDSGRIAEAVTSFEDLESSVKSLLGGDMAQFASLFDGIYKGINKSALAAYKFKKVAEEGGDLKNTLDSFKGQEINREEFLLLDKKSEGMQDLIAKAKEYGVITDDSTQSLEHLASVLVEMGVLEGPKGVAKTIKQLEDETESYLGHLNGVIDIVNKQKSGQSISLSDFNAEGMKEYQGALENINGAMQINAEKARDIAKAQAEQKLATIETHKALDQQKYLKNAQEIEKLQRKLEGKGATVKANIQTEIDALTHQNETIAESCLQYDLLSSSIREAIGSYQHWLNAQSSSDYGDMANDAVSAIQQIFDTYDESSDIFGNFGSKKFEAALDFIIPKTVNRDDLDAVDSYMQGLNEYLNRDDKGKIESLNIDKFLEDSLEKGLMTYSEDDGYKILGGMKMEDFVEGLEMSSGMVQAFFDELSLKGGKFNWADESVQTVGDLGIKANESMKQLKALAEYKDLDLDINFLNSEGSVEDLESLNKAIKEMDGVIAEVGIDSSEGQAAADILQFCIAQKQILTQPDIMYVDTSQVEGAIGESIALLQAFQKLLDEKELKEKVGLDTTQVDFDISALLEKIKDDPGMITLDLDTASVETVKESIENLKASALVSPRIGVSEDAISNYNPESKTVKYNPDTGDLPTEFDPINVDVNYKQKGVSSLPSTFPTITRYVNYVPIGDYDGGKSSSKTSTKPSKGAGVVGGTANMSGDWGTAHGGTTLVGELGREIVVDPRSGRWYTVGDNGAEFANIPAGSIVFNHLQTQDLLEHGYVSGRASALVSGTAMVTGGYKQYKPSSSYNNKFVGGGTTNKYKDSTTSATHKHNNDKEDRTSIFDYIEVAIDRIERAIKSLDKTAKSAFEKLSTRMSHANDEIAAIYNEINIQDMGRQRYLDEANAVGLSSDLAQKVRDGAIDISEYDEETSKLIGDYQKWYEKALDCADAIDELHESIANLYKDKFDTVASEFENQLSLLEHLTNSYNASMENIELRGYIASTQFYTAMQKVEKQNIGIHEKELSALIKAMSEGINSGTIKEGSEAWYEMQQQINEVKEAIQESENKVVELANSIREVKWGHFDYLQEQISGITEETEFLIELMSSSKLYDDRGQLTDTGKATMGMHGQNYNVYMNQADRYADEVKRINSELANDPNNTTLISRREELLRLQRESILAAESEKQAIVDMVEEGIQLELDALKELIDTYTKALDSSKDLYDYQKNIKKQTDEIAKLQKQLSSFAGDDSEENKAVVQRVQVELDKALEQLEETQYERYISDQKKLLDSLYLEYETILNERLDNVDALLADMIAEINSSSATIGSTITAETEKVGYTLSESMKNIWLESGSANIVITKYGEGFINKLTAVNNAINGIAVNVAKMVQDADAKAKAEAEKHKPSTPVDKNAKPPVPKPSTNNKPSKPAEKAITVGGLINAKGAKIYSYAGSTKGLKQYYGNDPIYTVLQEQNGYILARHHNLSSGYTGWFKKGDVKAYKKGGLVDYTGLAWVDGQKGKPESFLNAEDTDNITKLRDALRAMNEGQISLDGVFGGSAANGVLKNISTPNVGDVTSVGDINFEINIPIDHVSDYNDFVNQLRADNKFEKMVQSMTIDRIAGGSKFAKNKYTW